MCALRNLHSGLKMNTLYPEQQTLPVKGKFAGGLKWGDTEVEKEVFIMKHLSTIAWETSN